MRVPGFRLLLGGQAINAIGNWVAIIAVWGFAAFEFDAGAGDLALLFVVLSLPGALLGPLLGVPIDRFGPRRTLIAANLAGLLALRASRALPRPPRRMVDPTAGSSRDAIALRGPAPG